MIKRHGTAAVSTLLLLVAIVLLAFSEEKAAVFVALASLVVALVGSAITSFTGS